MVDAKSSVHAFRAILAQLLSPARGDKELIDIASAVRYGGESGQTTATLSEIRTILNMIVRRKPNLVLMFDGVDECQDHQLFQKHILEMVVGAEAAAASISVSLFSRPDLPLLATLGEKATLFTLSNELNLSDLTIYTRQKLDDLAHDFLLPVEAEIGSLSQKICYRANGMFLWAHLFTEYLRLPGLSMRQRLDSIDHLSRLQGLDALYDAILDSIAIQSFGPAKTNVLRVFEMVAFSAQPLHIDELMHAVSIPLDRKVDEQDIIPDFGRALPRMTGSLIEVSSSGAVQFIHASAVEYLSDPLFRGKGVQTSFDHVRIDQGSSQFQFLAVCLSYLLYSVLHEPLSGSSQVAADAVVQKKRYPFLQYASRCWSHHLLCVISDLCKGVPVRTHLSDKVFELTSKFLNSQPAISLWIEASWVFGHAPSIGISNKDPGAFQWKHDLNLKNYGHASLVCKVIRLLHELREDLVALNMGWGTVLMTSPNEIWEPSISAFTNSRFWLKVPGSTLLTFSNDRPQPRHICLKSQVSSCGTIIAIAKLVIVP